MPELHAVIMAAGRSRRMVGNKLLLPFCESTVIDYFLKKFPYHLFKKTFLIFSDDAVSAASSKYPLNVINNRNPGLGKSETIRLGIENCSGAVGAMFFVADQPNLRPEVTEAVVNKFLEFPYNIIIPISAGKERNPVMFPANCFSELSSIEGDAGGRVVIEKNRGKVILVDIADSEQFLDVDNRENYLKAKRGAEC